MSSPTTGGELRRNSAQEKHNEIKAPSYKPITRPAWILAAGDDDRGCDHDDYDGDRDSRLHDPNKTG